MQWLRRELPNLVIAPAHDYTDYGRRLVAALSDDELGELGELADSDLAGLKAPH
ncbi:hypothetical protein ABH920_009787 [Catenulispora sp. EB89]|uniref:hypothetical protein n=1 Tax=Catenulispora sp. EB89 TaxID=3156257 RepID=UPI0035193B8D